MYCPIAFESQCHHTHVGDADTEVQAAPVETSSVVGERQTAQHHLVGGHEHQPAADASGGVVDEGRAGDDVVVAALNHYPAPYASCIIRRTDNLSQQEEKGGKGSRGKEGKVGGGEGRGT